MGTRNARSTTLFPDIASGRPFLRRIGIRNYKSIEKCIVAPGKLTMLIGRNGAGKSNFLDALRFVADGLQTSLDHAIKSRGGIDAVRRRSTGHPRNFAFELQFDLPDFQSADYSFEISAMREGGFQVKQEQLTIQNAARERLAFYRVTQGQVKNGHPDRLPPASPDRLYLVTASGLPMFRPVYDALISMGFYNLNPDEMKKLQSPDAGELLHRDGANIASVVARLKDDQPEIMNRIQEYVARIVPGVKGVDRKSLGAWETLEFQQEVKGSHDPWRFQAVNMSDGTLRALGTLAAVMQRANRTNPVALVGIEEPETALHAGAAGALMDALREAANHTQVIVTTHSPDLLNEVNIDAETLFVVKAEEGTTRIARPDNASLQAIREHLYTPGELLRMDQLEPDLHDVQRQQQFTMSFDNGRDETV
jgi:predicted ATPase